MFSSRYVDAGDKAWIGQLGYVESLAVARVGDVIASYAEPIRSAEMEEWWKVDEKGMAAPWAALVENEVQELVELPPGHRSIKSEWILNLKFEWTYHARWWLWDTRISRYYKLTKLSCSSSRVESLRSLLALAALEDCHKMVVQSATLNSMLKDEM